MQGAPLFTGKVIAFIIGNEVDDRPVSQGRRLVEHDAPILDARSEGAHIATIRACEMTRNPETARGWPKTRASEAVFRAGRCVGNSLREVGLS
jgi:hypothetical protein